MKKLTLSLVIVTSFLVTIQIPRTPHKFTGARSKSYSFTSKLKNLKNISIKSNLAHAALRTSERDMAKMLYELVNGDGASDEGLIGIIRDIIGPTSLGGGLLAAGASSCSDIPTSGDYDYVENNYGGGGSTTFSMYFGPGALFVPARFSRNGGVQMNKRIEVSNPDMGNDFFIAEFLCSANSTVISGYIRMVESNNDIDQDVANDVGGAYGAADGTSDTQHFETYFEFDTASDVIDMDFYSSYTTSMGAIQKFAVKASILSSSEFKFWGIRHFDPTAVAGSISNAGFAYHADKDDDLMILYSPTGGNAATDTMDTYIDQFCINNISGAAADVGGGLPICTGNSPALTVANPGSMFNAQPMTIDAVTNMTLSAITHTLH